MSSNINSPTCPAGLTSSIDVSSKPLNDNRSYRVITLQNGLEALLIHDQLADKASASLDVNIGYYEDPDDLPGLAHFCEHLLFMGTEKYPSENEYSQYMSQHSGDSNAYTSAEHTNYQFQVGYKHFEGAIDRFSQFFISPLFLPSCKDREVRAVDSENKNNLQNDVWRLQHLMGYLANEKHPQHKYSTGNLETLETIPNSKNINVRDRLLQFYDQYYSANIMKLVLLGREDLDTLQGWALKYFSPIVNKNVTRPIYNMPRLTEAQLGECIYVKPVKDIRRLTLDFPIPDQALLYNSRPGSYLGSVLGHEGNGSLLQYLKEKGWASALMAGSYEICVGQNKFQITVELTTEGLANYKQVIEAVFQYIKLMRSEPVQKHIFEEQKIMSEINFKYQPKGSARSTTSSLASRLQGPYPRERILDFSVFSDYDPELIHDHIKMLTPRSFRASLVAKNLNIKDFKTEHYYGTQYQVERFSDEFLETLENLPLNSKLSLPKVNEFIPDNFSVEKKQVATPQKYPYLIRDSKQLRVWYKKDDTFWTPKADIRLCFNAPMCHASPKNAVSTSLFFSIFEDSLSSFAYDAEVAGLGYAVSPSKHGFTVRSQGYNSKLGLLLNHILDRLSVYELDDLRFDVWKERLIRSYQNIDHTNTYHQADYHSFYLMEEHVYPIDERLKALEELTVEDLKSFGKAVLKQLNVEVLAVGNLSRHDVLEISENALSILKPRPLPESQTVGLRTMLIPRGQTYQFNHVVQNQDNVNSCVKVFFQVCKMTDKKTRVLLELFSSIAREPAFNVLRTREQLGYVVFSGVNSQRTTCGFQITVQSERSTAVLQQRIDKFLVEFKSNLESFFEADVKKYVDSLIHKKEEKYQNMVQESNAFHAHISSGFYNFLVTESDVEILKTLRKSDVVDFFNTYIAPSSPTRSILYINIKSSQPKQFTPDQIASSVFNNLASKYKLEITPGEAVEIATKAKDLDTQKFIEFCHGILTKKGHGALAPRFLDSVVKEIGDLSNIEENGFTGTEIESPAWFKSRMSLTEAPVPCNDISVYKENSAKL